MTTPHQLLLLDTGPLRELVTYRVVYDLNLIHLRGELLFLQQSTQYRRFSVFLSRYSEKSTTSSVVAELYRWIRDNKQQISPLWKLTYDEFKKMGMEEEVVKLLEMQRDLVAQCGPTDAGLLSLAQKYAASNPTVVTIDRELWSECKKAKVDTIHVDEIMNPWK
jgi:rRNA-processing protein FCF1